MRIDTQQGVAEHRRRAVQIVGCEHHCQCRRIEPAQPFIEPLADLLGQASRIESQLILEPFVACLGPALRRLALALPFAEEGIERRIQFGSRIVLAVGSQKKLGEIDRTLDTSRPAARPIVQQGLPHRCMVEPALVRLLLEFGEVTSIGHHHRSVCGHGESGLTQQAQQSQQKKLAHKKGGDRSRRPSSDMPQAT